MEIWTVLLIVLGALFVLLVLDLLLTGGAGTMGMMHGTAMMMSNPVGLAILLVLLSILGVLVYSIFFQ